jgi:hypothetical protein
MSEERTVPCNRCQKPIVFAGQDENGKWIRNNPDGTPHVDEQRPGGGFRGKTPEEMRDIRRESALKSAVEFANGKLASGTAIATKDVLSVAQAFLDFIEAK